MQTSDFLTILGLGLAIWSFIPHRERDFILLFFSRIEIGLFIFGLFYIHFLMSFDWVLDNWTPWLSVFTISKGIPANIYAYLFSLVMIAWPIFKVTTLYFSGSRLSDLIKLYKSLLYDRETDLLHSYISKYHAEDIKKYLIGKSHLADKEAMDIILRRRTKADKEYEKLVSPKRIKFASYVYGNIIQDETFVRTVAPKYPELFGRIFRGMETQNASNQDLVKLYIEVLFESKNNQLINELKIANESNSSILERDKYMDLPILSGLFVNTKAASANYVWYPVGEGMVRSINHDKDQKEFLLKEYDSGIESELWNQKIWIGTVYFNYMVRETIYRNSDWHMWLFYFRHNTDDLIQLIPTENSYNHKSEYPSFAHLIIYRTFGLMFDWIALAKELKTDNRVIDTIRCLGWCLDSLNQTPESKISRKFKINWWDRVITLYCNYAYEPDNVACTTARTWFLKLFHNPKGVDTGTPKITGEYLSILKETWEKFDDVPFTHHGQGHILTEFRDNVLVPLGINEDQ